ncbi:MAG TPA: methionine adenosyltransferase, partial [Syntrophobacteraceae bacterium]|nr:methionine adenosyltransferase [Syntrophobacteraceae bacterium]
MAMKDYVFTSESVAEGHPDKVADRISDSILDAILTEDKSARVACETLVTTGLALVAGEITTSAWVDIPDIVRSTIRDIGYNDSSMGFDWETCAVLTSIDKQSPDIAMGVNAGEGLFEEMGAGDQGLMVGFACTETPVYMPMPIYYAHRITRKLGEVRKNGVLDFLRPDGKSQVTVEYRDDKPFRIDTVVVAAQHAPAVTYNTLR